MVPRLIARVDGLPLSLLDRELVWPVPDVVRDRAREVRSARRRARIERQTAVVRAALVAGSARVVLQQAASELSYFEAEAERFEIWALLAQRGVL